ncbi:L-aspartate oxidase [Planctomicrobium piriforme]|uniref:L-aspartate oxidase n=1 Tax=Planctomicrobium piriforme TaxID=1576369 RepID=A0A1I3CCC1_9PLAN|nr:L-aspartate oxidase [Planctomicrobium piriforme]SFH72204.1 L-aspartate oxidase [Planctomicrobium piriforme]
MISLEYQPRRRYLVQFHPKRIPHVFTDVLIIGAGIAGIRAALEIDPRLRVVIITKDVVNLSNSAWAQGGIAGALDPSDATENHAEDTMIAGAGLCDAEVVRRVVDAAPRLIRELASLGAKFDQKDGHIALTTEGGHSHARIAHALGDATGKEIMRALIATVRGADWSEIWEKTFTLDLLTQDGACRGALVWNAQHGRTFVWAKQTILATGGAGRVYRETTNPDIATADGHAIAFRAGAELRDMEMMQFHPTVLYIAGSSRHLVSEAVRGEGGRLVDVTGYAFMRDYDPRGELAPRDIVSRAITDQMEKTRHPCVYLDVSHIDPLKIRERFPHISQMCQEFGLDLTRDRIPVRPGAHYMMGGLTVDLEGRTTLPQLWAAGEVTSSGLHGANRLASNSLLEGLYYGVQAGRGASQAALSIPDQFTFPPLESQWTSEISEQDDLNLVDLQNALGAIMWRNVGIRRDGEGLSVAASQVDFWDRYVATREFHSVAGWELQNMLLVSRLMIESARARHESRGVHYRSDYPQTDPSLASHVTITNVQGDGISASAI